MERSNVKVYFTDKKEEKTDHRHDLHQILLIMKGEVEIVVNGVKRNAGAGDIVLFSRFENHSIHVKSEVYERYVLHMTPKESLLGDKLYALLSNRPLGFSNVIPVSSHLPRIESIFSALIGEESRDRFYEEMSGLLINELLILLCRLLPPHLFSPEEEGFETVWAIQKRFERDFGEEFRLGMLAKEYHISPSTLSHHFKRITGASVMDYLMSCRLAAAKDRLIRTSLSVGEIVEACGFRDASNFSRYFKEKTGLSPSDFRKKYKAK